MKCVRCGKETPNKTSFCDECEKYINKNKDTKRQEINLDYILVILSVIAVLIMFAIIFECYK